MMYSLVLFVHIAGVVALFAGLALEGFGIDSARKAAPRIAGIAMGFTLLSGIYLGSQFGVMREPWTRASYIAIVVMAAASALGRRSDRLARMSLGTRTSFALGIVFLMSVKPDAVISSIVLVLAAIGSLVALPLARKPRVSVSSYTGA